MRRYLRHFATLAVVGPLVGFIGCAGNSSDDSSGGPTGTGTTNSPDASTGKDGSTATNKDGGQTGTTGTDGGQQTGTTGTDGGQTGTTGGGDGGGTGPVTGGDGGMQTGTGDGGTTPTADGGVRSCPVASTNVLADFEDDKLAMVNQGGHDGTWGPYADATGAATTLVLGAPPAGNAATCDKFAAHAQATGHGAAGQFAGINGNFTKVPAPYDLSAYTGIQFDIVSGSGTQTGLYLSIPTTDTLPAATISGGVAGGTAANVGVNQFNSRGAVLPAVTTTWQTVVVPFATLIPQYFPSPSASSCTNGMLCQAPAFVTKDAIEMQFSIGSVGTNPGTLNIWVDNIQLVTDASAALKPSGMPNNIAPTFADGALGSCTKPTGAKGADLQAAYKNWYNRFVVSSGGGLRVQRPENNDDTVSEGIAYGMLIAVYMNDPTLFAGLWTYWQSQVQGGTTDLMNWQIPSQGSSGSATDADQDAAFALLQASVKFNNASYKTAGTAMVQNIYKYEVDTAKKLPTGGANYSTSGGPTAGGGTTTNHATDPSYFAPAYYAAFKKADATDDWAGVGAAVTASINTLGNASQTGLIAAWCTNGCTQVGQNTAATDVDFQYDSHRIPWRFGLDTCWHGTAVPAGVSKLVNYLTGMAASTASTGGGIARILDQYTLTGGALTNSEPNSMSLIGALGVGAMATGNSAFVNAAWQFVLDGGNRATLDVAANGSQSAYSYYNATVGLLTALTMSGNVTDMF